MMKRRRKAENTESGPLSAVAARKYSKSRRLSSGAPTEFVQDGLRQLESSSPVNHARTQVLDHDHARNNENGEDQHSIAEASNYDSEDDMAEASVSDPSEDVIKIEESSGSESDTSKAKLPAKSTTMFSSFEETPDTAWRKLATKRSVHVTMKPGEYITFLGHLDFRVRRGLVNVCGATLEASKVWHRLYSPSTHALCPIRCVHNGSPELLKARLEIRPFHSGIRAMEELSRSFASIWNPDKDKMNLASTIRGSSYIWLNSTSHSLIRQSLIPLQLPSRWEMTLQEYSDGYIRSRSSTLICGPKGTGKSTCSRLLVNTLLTLPKQRKGSDSSESCVAFLDLDPGQPEYTPPGNISLSVLHSPVFGPPFTHPGFSVDKDTTDMNRIIRCHFVAATTPKHDPGHFDECVRDLMARYFDFIRVIGNCPLVVNCPGWIQGAGFEFMKRIIRLIRPDQIVYMSQEGPQRVVDGIQQAAGKSKFLTLPSQNSEFKTRTSVDLRMMQTTSYFHLSSTPSEHLLWTAKTVMSQESWDFNYAESNRGILGIMMADENCQSSQLQGLLDGSIVGIIALDDSSALHLDPEAKYVHLNVEGYLQRDSIEDDDAKKDKNPEGDFERKAERMIRPTKESLPYIPGPLPLPSKSQCVGLGFVRSIDILAKTMSIVTPILKSQIAHLQDQKKDIVLVLGRLDTPGWAYAEEAVKSHFRWKRQIEPVAAATAADTAAPSGETSLAEKARIADLLERSPWLKERSSKEKRPGERPWKVRRNLVMR